MADETKTPTPLSEASGMTMEQAAAALRELNAKFEAQNAETAKLRATVVAQQATIEKMGASKAAAKFGQIPIEVRHCNTCGTRVEEGQRCPRHRSSKINELGTGMLHNRMQPIIIRQV